MSFNRRDFLQASAAAGLVSLTSTAIGSAQSNDGAAGALTEHKLPELPYAYNALEPHIDEQTMRLHHGKHHAAYVAGLNAAEKALAQARQSGDFAMVQYWSRKVAFNGGGHWLHTMFWDVMAPSGKGGGGRPSGELASMIDRDFGSYELFKKQFTAAAVQVEGSGWALLHYRHDDRRLVIMQAENQQKLTSWGTIPVLGVDVWEHAYYLKYQNRRADYVEAWWNVVNWNAVAKRIQAAQR